MAIAVKMMRFSLGMSMGVDLAFSGNRLKPSASWSAIFLRRGALLAFSEWLL